MKVFDPVEAEPYDSSALMKGRNILRCPALRTMKKATDVIEETCLNSGISVGLLINSVVGKRGKGCRNYF